MKNTIITILTLTLLTLGSTFGFGKLSKLNALPANYSHAPVMTDAETEAACRVNSVMVQQLFAY